MADDNQLVKVRDVHKVFKRGAERIDVLNGLNLEVPAGDFLALMGPSGSGKTTLLNLIGGLDRPSSGSIEVGGEPIHRLSGGKLARWRARHVGFVFQFYNLLPVLTAERNVELPLLLTSLSKKERMRHVSTALDVVGLSDRARHYPRQLSGGMRMRVSIARSLVTDPNLLLMDEPFGALDEFTRNRLDADLVRLWWERKLTTVFVTHSIYEAVFLSTRVVVMGARPGRVFKVMTIDEPHPRDESFRNSPRFAEYCRALSASLTEVSLEQMQR
jgi:NitT/TauT family transport system ATP-binding protein